ncbi:MAG: pentapeptide repeat-containing protein [Acidimicrobiales bacterium]
MAYATAAYPSFDTGITSIGTIDLVPGLNFAVSMGLPSSITTALSPVNITLPSTVLAVGSFDTSTDTFNLAISVTFATAVQLFDDQGVALDLNSASVTLEVSPSQVSISFSMDGTLYPDGLTGQQVAVKGTLSAVIGGSPSVSIRVAVNESTLGKCGSGSGWLNAFSDNGLTVECAEVSVGVTTVFPFVSGSINGVITQLPSDIASAIGYQSPAPIVFAFGFNPYYLDLSIGTYGSSAVALEPLKAFDNGSYATDLEVNYAQLCFMLPGAQPLSLGPTLTCSPGFVLAFTATIDASIFKYPVKVNFLASLSIADPTSFQVTASISQITVGQDLNVGPVTLVVCGSTSPTCDNSTSYFQFEFDGSFSLSGSVTVPDLVQLSGSLSLTLNVDLSTSGFSAFASGSASGTVTGYNPFANCSGTWYNPATWSCSGAWDSPSSFSFKLGTTGIAAGSTGLTVTIDGYSVTFPFNTNDPPSPPVPTTAVTLSSSVNGTSSTTSTYGQSVTLTATVTTTGPTFDGGGTVSFYVGAEPIAGCSGTTAMALTDSSGTYTATCTTSQAVVPSSNDTMILPGGSDSIVAEYSGDTGFPPAESSALVETVSPASPTLTVTSTPSPDYYGQSLSLSVSVSPTDGGGTVTFMDNGTSIPGCVTLSLTGDAGLGRGTDDSAQATCVLSPTVAAGTHPITVSYTGDASANAATSAIDDVVVNKDNTTTSVSESPTTVNYGNESASVFTVTVTTAHGESLPTTDPVTVNVGSASCVAPVAPSSGGGTGTCSIGNTDLAASTAAYQVTATYTGDTDLKASGPATATTGLTVQKDPTTTVVSVSESVTYANETSVAFTVAVTPDYGLTAPSEKFTITVGSTSCDVTLADGEGSCSITTPVLPEGGPYTLSATYPGATNFRSSTGTSTFDVVTTSTPGCAHDAGANLTGANFAGADLAGCDLSGANLKNANLEGASLAGANLTGANLKGAVLQGDNLVNADLQGANLMGDNVQFANLQNADVRQSNWQYANLYETYDFSGANLEGANFQKANLTDANLTDANLTDANFHFADLENANLTGAIIKGTQFRGANMTGTTS